MKRTRKWAFVAQEATRLAGLGLAPVDIAQRLGVRRSTVQRWMAAGKLADTRRTAPSGTVTRALFTKIAKPSAWASEVRREYALNATDNQLVNLAESALGTSMDPLQPMSIRLSAMARFQGLVKQLALVARSADVAAQPEQPAAVPAVSTRTIRRRPSIDPRNVLKAVK